MHKEILSENQIMLLPLVRQFIREYYLAGGTAIGLHLGHRRSIDFDLFKFSAIRPKNITGKIAQSSFPYTVTRRVQEQLNVTVHGVKFTFFEYPFQPEATCKFLDYLRMPCLLDLAAMKAYALGRRSKWKDYVDLYFILKDHYSIDQVCVRAGEIFGQLFSEKLFRAQLSYFKDIDYAESIDYLGPAVSDERIRNFLIDTATDIGSL